MSMDEQLCRNYTMKSTVKWIYMGAFRNFYRELKRLEWGLLEEDQAQNMYYEDH